MAQNRRMSAAEAVFNIVVGLVLSVVLNYLVLSYFGYPVRWHEMSWLAFIMTIASFARSYLIRRWFNSFE